MPPEAIKLLAAGVPFTLGGEEHTARFSLGALAELEAAFGSIKAIEERLRAAIEAEDAEFSSPVALDLALILASASGLTVDYVLGNVVGFPDVVAVVHRAWLEAWPSVDPSDAEGKAPAATVGTGVASTTAAPSPGDAATPSSGG